jgi:hypothetical protein
MWSNADARYGSPYFAVSYLIFDSPTASSNGATCITSGSMIAFCTHCYFDADMTPEAGTTMLRL